MFLIGSSAGYGVGAVCGRDDTCCPVHLYRLCVSAVDAVGPYLLRSVHSRLVYQLLLPVVHTAFATTGNSGISQTRF